MEMFRLLEGGVMEKYQIIYADPPWKYRQEWGNGAAKKHYNGMELSDICNLKVKEITDENAHLYLWVTNPFLVEGFEVCKAWGFEYKTLITWHKLYRDGTPEMGMGRYFRGCTEHLIFGVKGNMKCLTKTEKNLVAEVNPKEHSRKPDLFRQKIVKDWSGDLPRLEMFARGSDDLFDEQMFEGWDLWGNESPNSSFKASQASVSTNKP